ncbi:MAG: hypothetical protein ACEPOV_14590 [Hyphomicrobiales bacterium]
MKTFVRLILLLSVITLVSCKNESKNNVVLAKKIQYDVSIKSPDSNYDWWIQNLVGPERERFTELIFDAVLSNKIQAYDYFNKPISANDINKILYDTTYTVLQRDYPPFEEYDTLYVKQIRPVDIERIRFLEEWKIDTTSLQVEKKVFGIAPIIKEVDDNGNFRGWYPLFWIYTDKEFTKQMSKAYSK